MLTQRCLPENHCRLLSSKSSKQITSAMHHPLTNTANGHILNSQTVESLIILPC